LQETVTPLWLGCVHAVVVAILVDQFEAGDHPAGQLDSEKRHTSDPEPSPAIATTVPPSPVQSAAL